MNMSISVTVNILPYQRRKKQREFLYSVVKEVIAEIAMEDEAERNGTLHPDLVKERKILRAAIA